MTVQEQLRDAMEARAQSVHSARSFDEVRERVELEQRRLRRRNGARVLVLAAAAAIALIFVTPWLLAEESFVEVDVAGTDDPPGTTPSVSVAPELDPDGESTDEEPNEPLAPVTTRPDLDDGDDLDVPVPADGEFVWIADDAGPLEAARSFAVEFLGMRNPFVASVLADPQSISVRATERGPETIVQLQSLADGRTGILSARSANLVLDSQAAAEITSPVTIQGMSRSFEATVQVEIRQDGQLFGEKLAEGFTMGGAGPEMAPFSISLSFAQPSRSTGVIIVWTMSAEDGSVFEATAVPVRFATAP